MIVVDASTIVEALTNGTGTAAEALLDSAVLIAPAHLDAEVGHALRGLVRANVLQAGEAIACLDDLALSRILRVDLAPLLGRAFELRDHVSFNDALYLALAELYETTLLTADAKLARVPGARCPVELVES